MQNTKTRKTPKMVLMSQTSTHLANTLELLRRIQDILTDIGEMSLNKACQNSVKMLTIDIRKSDPTPSDFYTSDTVLVQDVLWPQLEFTYTKELQIYIKGERVPHFMGIEDTEGLKKFILDFYKPYWARDFTTGG